MNTNEILAAVDRLFSEQKGKEACDYMLSRYEEAAQQEEHAVMLALANELCGYYRDLGDFDRSLQYADEALKQIVQLKQEGSVAHATTLLNAATAFRAAGCHDDAKAAYEMAGAIFDLLLPPEDMRIASLHNNLSLLYIEQGRFEDAIRELETALDIDSRNPGTQIEAATSKIAYGQALMGLERFDEAEQILLESKAAFEEERSPRDFHYPMALGALAQVYELKKQYRKAGPLYEAAAEELKKNVGESQTYMSLLKSAIRVYKKIFDENSLQRVRTKMILGGGDTEIYLK